MNWDTHPHRTALIKRQPIEIELDKRKTAAIQRRGDVQHPPFPGHVVNPAAYIK